MNSDKREDYTLASIEAVYGREAANKEAARLDEFFVMHPMLLVSYMQSSKNLPFDISATPNFVKRFKQAGVDIKQNH